MTTLERESCGTIEMLAKELVTKLWLPVFDHGAYTGCQDRGSEFLGQHRVSIAESQDPGYSGEEKRSSLCVLRFLPFSLLVVFCRPQCETVPSVHMHNTTQTHTTHGHLRKPDATISEIERKKEA
jgi:hypothetical protein